VFADALVLRDAFVPWNIPPFRDASFPGTVGSLARASGARLHLSRIDFAVSAGKAPFDQPVGWSRALLSAASRRRCVEKPDRATLPMTIAWTLARWLSFCQMVR
jgi:hypothetical protein